MPRPKRSGWSKITITVSDKVARDIRVAAATKGIEMGTFVDQALRDHRQIPIYLERILAIDIERGIKDHSDHQDLVAEITRVFAENLEMALEPPLTYPALVQMSAKWTAKGAIPQPWKWAAFLVLCSSDWTCTILEEKLFDGFDWFKR
ncbi:MAG: hypothetical protein P4L50_00390 [Anaerolineaceae bacterium]|nr:hypothetical protein [Anaerolineaceae bacterium]